MCGRRIYPMSMSPLTRTTGLKAIGDLSMNDKKIITVAVGVIKQNHQILLAKRPDNVHQGGKWEFPGGKVEPQESVTQALTRELEEELAITITDASHLLDVHHDYPELTVNLCVYLVEGFSGTPVGNEGQEVVWVAIDDLSNWSLPEANTPIVNALEKI